RFSRDWSSDVCSSDLSAVLHAGGKPMLVDLEPERPWMQRAELHARLDGGVAAVVAVNFLGIPERLQELAVAAEAAGALLIEDSRSEERRVGKERRTGS